MPVSQRILPTLLSLGLGLGLAGLVQADDAVSGKPVFGSFGIALLHRDLNVLPGDDFNRYANGIWQDTYQLKDHETRYGAFTLLSDQAEIDVRAIIEGITDDDAKRDPEAQQVRDLYRSVMNIEARNQAGLKPIQKALDQIAQIKNSKDLAEAFGRAPIDGSISPFFGIIGPDRKAPEQNVLSLIVGGLGLPDREYYTDPAPRFIEIRKAYRAHIAKMLSLAGFDETDARAESIMKLETEIAKHLWPRAELRDRDKTYNLVSFKDLKQTYKGFDWALYFRAAGIKHPPKSLNLNTPSAMPPIVALTQSQPVAVWRDYLRFHTIDNNAPLLTEELDNTSFAFNGTVLAGQKAQRELWKRALDQTGGAFALGDAVGKRYVAKHFRPESKAAMSELVENLRAALKQNIANLDWMSDATKTEAFRKLSTFRPKIGYPDKWRDYSTVTIVPDNLVANVRALREYNRNDQVSRLDKPTDRDEWRMTPQTINAYYNPTFNEIVFPAAILQPPFFDLNADPAVNYGAIGAVIGHEMGHGFDDQGSKSDADGIQRNWWTAEDRNRFEVKTKALGAQYNTYCPIDGQCVNGQLTMGENIGDLGGLSMALTAYRLSLHGKPAPVLEGLSGEQRFFLAWAQIWNAKYREEALLNQLRTDPHSPARYRINGPLRNMDAWYEAFSVTDQHKLFVKPEDRVRIW
ncbi:M13 family metallopeptidase [Ahniella affigens]|nr:M13 family metallopeptidase [Ahniella affigens]